MRYEPIKNKPYMLTFSDALGTYEAGPFVYEGEGVWANAENRPVKAAGSVVSYRPAETAEQR